MYNPSRHTECWYHSLIRLASSEAWADDLPPAILSVLSSTSELCPSPLCSPHLSLQTSSPGVPWSFSFPIALRVPPQCLMLNALTSSQDVPNSSLSRLSNFFFDRIMLGCTPEVFISNGVWPVDLQNVPECWYTWL